MGQAEFDPTANRALHDVAVAQKILDVTDLLYSIEGFLHPLEGFSLMVMAEHGPGSGVVLEIGSYLGRSTCYLALGAKAAGRPPIVAIDHFAGSPEHQPGASHESAALAREGTTFHQFLRNLDQVGVIEHVRAIQASSLDVAATWREPIRFLFIDGDHTYEATRDDFRAWSPHVEAAGSVAFHDIGAWPGVTRFYEELLAEGGWREIGQVYTLRIVRRA